MFSPDLWNKSSAADDYTIDNSLRFNPGDTGKLSRTPSSSGNKSTFTISAWAKSCNAGNSDVTLYEAYSDANNYFYVGVDATQLYVKALVASAYTNGGRKSTSARFRDPSAWYHFVIQIDTTQGVAANRIRLYVNGVEETAFEDDAAPSEDREFSFFNNSSYAQNIGYRQMDGANRTNDAYLAEYYFIDGTALTPASFGELDSDTNQWKPLDSDDVKDAVTFGTNGFYQKYSATELADSFEDSAEGHVIDTSGDVHTDTAVKKFGTASAQFDGDDTAAPDQLTVPSSSDWNPYGISFTAEFWLNVDSFAHSYDWLLGNTGVDSAGWNIQLQSSGSKLNFLVGNGSSWDINTVDSGTGYAISTDTWYHVAVVKSGTAWTMYVDGTSRATGTSAATDYNNTLQMGNSTLWHDAGSGGPRDFDGYLDEVRISNTARYTTTFTPSTTAFTNDSNTKLLMHMDGANDGTVFTDSSTAPRHTITAVGDVTNTRAVRKIGDSSIKFDGTGDYLSVPDSSDWDFGTGDFTFESWVYIDSHGANEDVFFALATGPANLMFRLDNSTDLKMNLMGTAYSVSQTLSEDTWYHLACVRDSGSLKFFVDGVQSGVSQSATDDISVGYALLVGGRTDVGRYVNGYMDEIRISNNARYSATFAPVPTTAFTTDANTKLLIHSNWDGGLGADSSGNYNTFTPTNLDATDQMIDTPTNNFATLSPVWNCAGSPAYSLSEGNLKNAMTTSGSGLLGSTIAPESGKWYCEYLCKTLPGSDRAGVGIADVDGLVMTNNGNSQNIVVIATADLNRYWDFGTEYDSATDVAKVVANDIVQFAWDVDTGKVWIGINNVWQGASSPNPATDTSPLATHSAVKAWAPILRFASGGSESFTVFFNGGSDSSFSGEKTAQGNQDSNDKGDFYYTPPTDYLALCTDNLSDPEIALPGENFETVLWAGDGADTKAIAASDFVMDFAWIKNRDGDANNHVLYDRIRGTGMRLVSNSSQVEADLTSYGNQVEFTAPGINVGSTNAGYEEEVNKSGVNYVAWNWKAGGAPTADNDNTTGAMDANSVALNGSLQAAYTPEGSPSIYPTKMSINTTAGFSIIEYDGNSTAGATLPHGLTQAPDITFVKELTYVDNWVGFAEPLGNTKALFLDQSNAAGTHTTYWNDAGPSATVITLGTDGKANSSRPHIMYAFHSVEGYSKVGSYDGNYDADGPFVYTGFNPAFVLIKVTNTADNWVIHDSARGPYNANEPELRPNTNAAEAASSDTAVDFLSNGFKLRNSDTGYNRSYNYIYYAVAENPFKYSNAR